MNKLSNALLAATALTAAFGFGGRADAAAIQTTFDFVPFGTVTANTNNVTTATSITPGVPDLVSTIVTDNTGLVSGTTTIGLTSPTPVTMNSVFTKSFTTALGDFVESLTVTSVSVGSTSLGIDAMGEIVETTVLSGTKLTSAPVYYSASYTQNGGPGAQINASFNDSTTAPPPPPPPPGPPGVPEPASMALLGTALVGLGALRRRRK